MRSRFFLMCIFAVLVACASPTVTSPRVVPTELAAAAPSAAAPAASNQPGAVACAATYKVPGNEFRSDDPAKLDAGNKPKLIEFFAFW